MSIVLTSTNRISYPPRWQSIGFSKNELEYSLIVLELCIQDKAQANDERRNNNESHYNTLPNINSKAFYPCLFCCNSFLCSVPIYRVLCSTAPVLHGAHPIYTCVAVVLDSLKLLSKNPSFFSKKYSDGWSWSALIFKRFFALFRLPFIGNSQKIGHTGIANTKKWLDQAVFPCWSNYHTLAGE